MKILQKIGKDYKDLDEQPAPPIPESKLVAPEPQLPKKNL